jgi:hypothetical protein
LTRWLQTVKTCEICNPYANDDDDDDDDDNRKLREVLTNRLDIIVKSNKGQKPLIH